MPRLDAVDSDTATGRTKELLDQVHRKLGFVPKMMRAMAVSPAVLEGYLGLSGALAGGALTPKVREQIALTVGEANACQYCVSAHTAIGKRLGLTEAELEASRDGAASDPEVAEIVAHVALNILTNYFNLTADTETDFPRIPLGAAPR